MHVYWLCTEHLYHSLSLLFECPLPRKINFSRWAPEDEQKTMADTIEKRKIFSLSMFIPLKNLVFFIQLGVISFSQSQSQNERIYLYGKKHSFNTKWSPACRKIDTIFKMTEKQ